MAAFNVRLFICFHRRASLLQYFSPANYTLRKKCSYRPTFQYSDLSVQLSDDYSLNRKPDFGNLKFGTAFSDHMLEIEWTEEDGWGKPKILPFHSLVLHPCAKVLHYAQAVFEGMKAFKNENGKITIFRPDMNMERLLMSSQRAALPSFDRDELLKCIKKLVSIDKKWVPEHELCSLYIRPNFIGTESFLGVTSSKTALLYVNTCPTDLNKQFTISAISLLADPRYVRAYPGGVGAYKMAANYAPTLSVQKIAQDQGLHQVLWLSGPDCQITEAGVMNVFFVLRDDKDKIELVTPSLDGTILPGVVRQSVLDLAKEWNEFKVSERPITMAEIIGAHKEGRLLEMFGSGTAAAICPMKLIKFKDINIEIPTMKNKTPLYSRFFKTLTDIQYGRVESKWSVPIEIE